MSIKQLLYSHYMGEPFFDKVDLYDKQCCLLLMCNGVLTALIKKQENCYLVSDIFSRNYRTPALQQSEEDVIFYLEDVIEHYRSICKIPFAWKLYTKFGGGFY